MVCKTVRKGMECPFMTAKGCTYNGGICHEITENCSGCNRTIQYDSGWYCAVSPDPQIKWKTGNCNLATHVKSEAADVSSKVNPLKASKRSKK